jgi:hypothetical protein
MAGLALIPQPAVLREGAGRFAVHDGIGIVVAHNAERGEWIAARAVQAALGRHGIDAPIQPQIRCPDTANTVVLAMRGRDADVFPTTPDAGAYGIRPAVPGGSDEAYQLTIDEQGVVVWGASPAGLAQGARTLCQLLATITRSAIDGLPAIHVEDAPALRWRGVMLDVSRGKVPTLATLKRIVDVIASYKLNMLQLYVEHTFAFRSHPLIGRAWGALTPEEIAELDRYCRDRYVELVPCLQSCGHHRRILELPQYAHLAASREGWTLAPREETYAFLDDLYADFLACFSSRYFHICCDETYDLTGTTPLTHLAAAGFTGRAGAELPEPGPWPGTSAAPIDAQGGRLYLGHIQRLHQLVAKYGRTMMMWDDIFLHYSDLVVEVPHDVVMMNWLYEAAPDYPQVEGFRDVGLQQIVCPGTSSWNTLFARLENARGNIRNFVAAGRRVGALGVLTTDWGDDGHPNLPASSWYGYAYTALEGWSPSQLDDEEFERRFAHLFFGREEAGAAMEAMRALAEACTLPGIERRNGSCSREMFFDDPLTDPYCKNAPEESVARMRELGARAQELLGGPATYPAGTAGRRPASGHGTDDEASLTLAELRFIAQQVMHAATKTQVGRQVAATADQGPRPDLHAQVLHLKRELHALRREYERLWLLRNKPEGLWLTLDQFDRSAQVLDQWRTQTQPAYTWG